MSHVVDLENSEPPAVPVNMVSIPEGPRTIVASPDTEFRNQVLEILETHHWVAEGAIGGAETLAEVEAGNYQVVLLDRWLPDLDVNELVGIIRQRHPQVEVVVVSSETGIPLFDEEPPVCSHLGGVLRVLQNLRESRSSKSPSQVAATAPSAQTRTPMQIEPLPSMIGTSSAMQRVYRLSRLVAPRSTTVLVTGETGTGKELVARAIHLLSPRNRQPFITVNCAAIPEPLLEAELFGHARGAFTGAVQSRLGRIHSAHGGTLFLDEVGELPLSMQAKLLRFLQEGEVQRLGSSDAIRVDVRVIAATNAELLKRVAEKAFREDLYYRVSAFPIDILPLRRRPEDIPPLGSHFLDSFCEEGRTTAKTVSSRAQQVLERHSWPGNVRELRHVIERAFILSEDSPTVLPEHISLQAAWRQS